MKARYNSREGNGIITMPDSATVGDLLNELRSKTGIADFTVQYGPPMARKNLDLALLDNTTRSVGLHGETLTIVTVEAPPAPPVPTTTQASRPQAKLVDDNDPEDISVPWRERDGTLLLRVMPSDNSCLFSAFGGALHSDSKLTSGKLRRMMADYITQHPATYTAAVLGTPPDQYCSSILHPDRWGGGIELSILSDIFNVQICTFDVQTQTLINFGENKEERCILLYSGIHYDRVVFSFTEPPHTTTTMPPDMDITLWSTTDNDVLEKTRELVRKLNQAHYFTDTDGLILKCDVPGCDWIGSGQREGQKHAEQTGHVDMSEIRDIEGDNVLRRCDSRGCSFIGQGDKAVSEHRTDTGHEKFSVILDC